MPVDAPPAEVHLIDYAYSSQDVFYHGTISDLDGSPKSTWTISKKNAKEKIDVVIDQETFSYLWNGIADFEVFKRHQVTSSETRLDFQNFQIIGIIYTQNGERKVRTYMIPPNEPDSDFVKWLKALRVPVAKSDSASLLKFLPKLFGRLS